MSEQFRLDDDLEEFFQVNIIASRLRGFVPDVERARGFLGYLCYKKARSSKICSLKGFLAFGLVTELEEEVDHGVAEFIERI